MFVLASKKVRKVFEHMTYLRLLAFFGAHANSNFRYLKQGSAKAGHLSRFSAQIWPSAWAKKSLDPAKSWPSLARTQAKKSGPAPGPDPAPAEKSGPSKNSGPGKHSCSAKKNDKNENNGPGVKLIEAKNIMARA